MSSLGHLGKRRFQSPSTGKVSSWLFYFEECTGPSLTLGLYVALQDGQDSSRRSRWTGQLIDTSRKMYTVGERDYWAPQIRSIPKALAMLFSAAIAEQSSVLASSSSYPPRRQLENTAKLDDEDSKGDIRAIRQVAITIMLRDWTREAVLQLVSDETSLTGKAQPTMPPFGVSRDQLSVYACDFLTRGRNSGPSSDDLSTYICDLLLRTIGDRAPAELSEQDDLAMNVASINFSSCAPHRPDVLTIGERGLGSVFFGQACALDTGDDGLAYDQRMLRDKPLESACELNSSLETASREDGAGEQGLAAGLANAVGTSSPRAPRVDMLGLEEQHQAEASVFEESIIRRSQSSVGRSGIASNGPAPVLGPMLCGTDPSKLAEFGKIDSLGLLSPVDSAIETTELAQRQAVPIEVAGALNVDLGQPLAQSNVPIVTSNVETAPSPLPQDADDILSYALSGPSDERRLLPAPSGTTAAVPLVQAKADFFCVEYDLVAWRPFIARSEGQGTFQRGQRAHILSFSSHYAQLPDQKIPKICGDEAYLPDGDGMVQMVYSSRPNGEFDPDEEDTILSYDPYEPFDCLVKHSSTGWAHVYLESKGSSVDSTISWQSRSCLVPLSYFLINVQPGSTEENWLLGKSKVEEMDELFGQGRNEHGWSRFRCDVATKLGAMEAHQDRMFWHQQKQLRRNRLSRAKGDRSAKSVPDKQAMSPSLSNPTTATVVTPAPAVIPPTVVTRPHASCSSFVLHFREKSELSGSKFLCCPFIGPYKALPSTSYRAYDFPRARYPGRRKLRSTSPGTSPLSNKTACEASSSVESSDNKGKAKAVPKQRALKDQLSFADAKDGVVVVTTPSAGADGAAVMLPSNSGDSLSSQAANTSSCSTADSLFSQGQKSVDSAATSVPDVSKPCTPLGRSPAANFDLEQDTDAQRVWKAVDSTSALLLAAMVSAAVQTDEVIARTMSVELPKNHKRIWWLLLASYWNVRDSVIVLLEAGDMTKAIQVNERVLSPFVKVLRNLMNCHVGNFRNIAKAIRSQRPQDAVRGAETLAGRLREQFEAYSKRMVASTRINKRREVLLHFKDFSSQWLGQVAISLAEAKANGNLRAFMLLEKVLMIRRWELPSAQASSDSDQGKPSDAHPSKPASEEISVDQLHSATGRPLVHASVSLRSDDCNSRNQTQKSSSTRDSAQAHLPVPMAMDPVAGDDIPADVRKSDGFESLAHPNELAPNCAAIRPSEKAVRTDAGLGLPEVGTALQRLGACSAASASDVKIAQSPPTSDAVCHTTSSESALSYGEKTVAGQSMPAQALELLSLISSASQSDEYNDLMGELEVVKATIHDYQQATQSGDRPALLVTVGDVIACCQHLVVRQIEPGNKCAQTVHKVLSDDEQDHFKDFLSELFSCIRFLRARMRKVVADASGLAALDVDTIIESTWDLTRITLRIAALEMAMLRKARAVALRERLLANNASSKAQAAEQSNESSSVADSQGCTEGTATTVHDNSIIERAKAELAQEPLAWMRQDLQKTSMVDLVANCVALSLSDKIISYFTCSIAELAAKPTLVDRGPAEEAVEQNASAADAESAKTAAARQGSPKKAKRTKRSGGKCRRPLT